LKPTTRRGEEVLQAKQESPFLGFVYQGEIAFEPAATVAPPSRPGLTADTDRFSCASPSAKRALQQQTQANQPHLKSSTRGPQILKSTTPSFVSERQLFGESGIANHFFPELKLRTEPFKMVVRSSSAYVLYLYREAYSAFDIPSVQQIVETRALKQGWRIGAARQMKEATDELSHKANQMLGKMNDEEEDEAEARLVLEEQRFRRSVQQVALAELRAKMQAKQEQLRREIEAMQQGRVKQEAQRERPGRKEQEMAQEGQSMRQTRRQGRNAAGQEAHPQGAHPQGTQQQEAHRTQGQWRGDQDQEPLEADLVRVVVSSPVKTGSHSRPATPFAGLRKQDMATPERIARLQRKESEAASKHSKELATEMAREANSATGGAPIDARRVHKLQMQRRQEELEVRYLELGQDTQSAQDKLRWGTPESQKRQSTVSAGGSPTFPAVRKSSSVHPALLNVKELQQQMQQQAQEASAKERELLKQRRALDKQRRELSLQQQQVYSPIHSPVCAGAAATATRRRPKPAKSMAPSDRHTDPYAAAFSAAADRAKISVALWQGSRQGGNVAVAAAAAGVILPGRAGYKDHKTKKKNVYSSGQGSIGEDAEVSTTLSSGATSLLSPPQEDCLSPKLRAMMSSPGSSPTRSSPTKRRFPSDKKEMLAYLLKQNVTELRAIDIRSEKSNLSGPPALKPVPACAMLDMLKYEEALVVKRKSDYEKERAKTEKSRDLARKQEAAVECGATAPVMVPTLGDGASFGEASEKLKTQQMLLRKIRDERMLLSMDVTTTSFVGAMSIRTGEDLRFPATSSEPMVSGAFWDEGENQVTK
jgi:hypothetical protein